MLYFAYGSNLCVDQMRRRCPRAKKVQKLYMTEAKLVFRGVADMTLAKDSMVPGGVWEITKECERTLDQHEGVRQGLYIKRYVPLPQNGVKRDCLLYQMKVHRGIQPPTDKYIDLIERGYDDFGLDKAYLNEALEDAWGRKDVTPMLMERWEQKGRPKLARI